MSDIENEKLLIMARMLALYTSLKRMPDDNPVAKNAMEAYLAVEDILESALEVKIRRHGKQSN